MVSPTALHTLQAYPVYDVPWLTRELLDESGTSQASYRTSAFGLVSPASSAGLSELSTDQWSSI